MLSCTNRRILVIASTSQLAAIPTDLLLHSIIEETLNLTL